MTAPAHPRTVTANGLDRPAAYGYAACAGTRARIRKRATPTVRLNRYDATKERFLRVRVDVKVCQ